METKFFTSLNSDSFVKMEIENFCKKYNYSKNLVIINLIKEVINNFNSGAIVTALTEYQDHKPVSWSKIDYYLSSQDNEIFGQARQKYKLSISKMLFIGFMLFWKKFVYIFKERLKKTEISFGSYDEFRKKYFTLIEYFNKRMNFIKKE